MGYTKPSYITIPFGFTSYAPTDGATVYLGDIASGPTATADLKRVYIPTDGVIRGCVMSTAAVTTAGSAENWLMSIRINNTTDYAIATVSLNVANRVWENYALNISVEEGDYFEVKMLNPTWATDPAGWRGIGSLLIEAA